jgi:DNA-binding CsgD family transcriptional regulator
MPECADEEFHSPHVRNAHLVLIRAARSSRRYEVTCVTEAMDGDVAGARLRSPKLSDAEIRLLSALRTESSTLEIARQWLVYEHTVRERLKRIFQKIGAEDRAQALAWLDAWVGEPASAAASPGGEECAEPTLRRRAGDSWPAEA